MSKQRVVPQFNSVYRIDLFSQEDIEDARSVWAIVERDLRAAYQQGVNMAYLNEAAGRAREAPYQTAGAPVAGTDEIQTLTFGGTPTGGTFKLQFKGQRTAAISWSATNATLVANIDAALEALSTIGTGNVTTAVGTMTAGIGTITVTFTGALGKKAVTTLVVAENSLTGTAPTLAVAETTPGVDASGRGAAKGAKLVDITNGIDYINTGTANAPTWTKTGTQT